QDVEALVALVPEEIPSALQMADQAVGLVLGRHADAADAGIERVREGEIDDAGLAAEIDRGLGPPICQLKKPAAPAAREHIGHGRTGIGGACGYRGQWKLQPGQSNNNRLPIIHMAMIKS